MPFECLQNRKNAGCSWRRVIDPTPSWATPPGSRLLIFSHASLKTVGTVIGFSSISSPLGQIPSLLCTFYIFQFLWYGSLCHRSSLENARPCVSQPWMKLRRMKHIWRKFNQRAVNECWSAWCDGLYSLHSWICATVQSFRKEPRSTEYWAFAKGLVDSWSHSWNGNFVP
jgi:hypothetical protein